MDIIKFILLLLFIIIILPALYSVIKKQLQLYRAVNEHPKKFKGYWWWQYRKENIKKLIIAWIIVLALIAFIVFYLGYFHKEKFEKYLQGVEERRNKQGTEAVNFFKSLFKK